MSSLFVEDPEYRAWEDWLEFHRSQSTEEGTGRELRMQEYGPYEHHQSASLSLRSQKFPPDSAVFCDSTQNPNTPESWQSAMVPQTMKSFGSSHHASSSSDTNESVASRGYQLGARPIAGGKRRQPHQTDAGSDNKKKCARPPSAPHPKGRGDHSRRTAEQSSSRVPTKTAEPPRRTSWEQQYWPIEGNAAHVETPSEHLDPHCDEPDPSLHDWIDNFLEYV